MTNTKSTLVWIVPGLLVVYLGLFLVFANHYHTSGVDPVLRITMPVWRVDDTPENRFLMKLFAPLLKLPPFNDRVEWM